MILKTNRASYTLKRFITMDAWALFRETQRRAASEEVYGHQFEADAGSHERSPPG